MMLLYAWNAAAGLSEPESTAARMLAIRPRSLKKAFSCACGPAESRPSSVCSAASAGGIALVTSSLVASRDAFGDLRPLSSHR